MRRTVTALLLSAIAIGAAAQDAPSPAAPLPPELPAPRLLGPRTGAEKQKALSANGGSSATEKAVAAGLDWLARHADEDGSWDADGFMSRCAAGSKACEGRGKGQHGEDVPCPFDEAISGLAVMAFLGAGHLPGAESAPYGPLVERSLKLMSNVGETWALPIATEALSEAEAMERRGRWRGAALAGAERLLSMRQKDGAWGYCAGFRPGSDVPYTAFVASALVAARDVGAPLPADLGTGVDGFLGSLEESKGRLAYLKEGRSYGYTPTTSNAHCAVAIRELLQTATAGSRHRAHAALVAEERPVWRISFREVDVPGRGKVPVQVGNLSLYQWWYGTVGKFQQGGTAWSEWFGAVKTALLQHQATSGCARGSWDPLGTYERQTGGRVFATAMAVLMLEQPYRHRRLGP
jgi:hypothetical protein